MAFTKLCGLYLNQSMRTGKKYLSGKANKEIVIPEGGEAANSRRQGSQGR